MVTRRSTNELDEFSNFTPQRNPTRKLLPAAMERGDGNKNGGKNRDKMCIEELY
jgi:hypothetical protein